MQDRRSRQDELPLTILPRRISITVRHGRRATNWLRTRSHGGQVPDACVSNAWSLRRDRLNPVPADTVPRGDDKTSLAKEIITAESTVTLPMLMLCVLVARRIFLRSSYNERARIPVTGRSEMNSRAVEPALFIGGALIC